MTSEHIALAFIEFDDRRDAEDAVKVRVRKINGTRSVP